MASSVRQARLRVNRSASLAITTTWQKIDFSGASTYNVNTFGKDPASGNQLVMWDNLAKQFRFYSKQDTNYICFINAMTTTNMIATRSGLQLRFVIPNGGGQGVNTYFPFPEEGGLIDIGEVTMIQAIATRMSIPIPLYLDSTMRANGCWIEMRLSVALVALGTCTLNNCTMLIQSTK